MSNAKLERLMNLIALLSEARKPLTFREITSMVPGYPETTSAARRAFERDKEDLRAMDFDISVEQNPDQETGYRINKNQTYYEIALTSAQRNTVQYALALYSPEETIANDAVAKLGGLNPENALENVKSLPMPMFIDELMGAIKDKKSIAMVFRGEKRNVLPKKLIARSGYWYVESHDLDKNQSRTFRVDRIESLDRQENNDFSINIDEIDSPEAEEQQVKFEVAVHNSLKDNFCKTWNAEENSSNGLIEFYVPRKEIFLARLFDYSGFVSISAPKEIANEISSRFDQAKVKI
ncbi:MAG: WYL domain-containing protein [Acidimicrobiia bacterium]